MKKTEWAVIPFNVEKIKDKYLVTNILGRWAILDTEEFRLLQSFNINEKSNIFKKLKERGIILDKDNLPTAIQNFRKLNLNIFTDTFLHIVVITTRCNLSCIYCQTKTSQQEDMSIEVASKVLEYIWSVRNPFVTLEFQGGEPLLNWKVMKFFIDTVRSSPTNRKVEIVLVTNGLLLDDEKIHYLLDNNVNICISFDGPQYIHDKNRIFSNGKGSYNQTLKAIKKLREAYKIRNMNRPIDLLLTLTKYSLSFPKEIVDEYIKRGAMQIALRPVNKIGIAKTTWSKIGYSPEEFNIFWKKALDYILELNKKGIFIRERMATIFLKKIFASEDPLYVDLSNPCGAGRSVLAYMPNGDVYPCDEARMTQEEMFRIGNVLKDEYEEVIKSANLFSLSYSSLLNLSDYNSAFNCWSGTCPVINYILTGNLISPIRCSPLYKIYKFQLKYIFEKILENPDNENVFRSWIET